VSVGGLFGFTLWELFDAVFILGLTYGIWKFSRICAVVLLAYFVTGRIMMWAQNGMPGSMGLLVAVVFIYFYGQAVRATFGYHKSRRSSTAAEQSGSS
jgi:serine/threonine-protein kinase